MFLGQAIYVLGPLQLPVLRYFVHDNRDCDDATDHSETSPVLRYQVRSII
jgi:hypothetical protein